MRRALLLLTICSALHGQDLEKIFEEDNLEPMHRVLATGRYDDVALICERAIRQGFKSPDWRLMRIQALMNLGREVEARDEVQLAVKTFPGHLTLLMLQHDNARRIGRKDIADEALKAVNDAARAQQPKDRKAADWVALGQAALALGADAKKVIQQYFQVAQKKDAKFEPAYLAEGHLALSKDDAARAADVFRAGLKACGETAELRVGLALAFANGDREKSLESLKRALELNPVHSVALLNQAESMIGAEKFLDAAGLVQKVLEYRDNCPQAWALLAAITHLSAADVKKFESARANGLKRWDKNPEVDHIIGRVLSRAYRFAEGSKHQRKALEFDASYLPAKVALTHDLLRLGEEEEAWKLAAEIREKDGYNVQAHNIGLLEKEMAGYTTQTFDDFILKMPKRDWPIYGEEALALLREAKTVLTAKYGLDLKRPVMVEFFGQQQDFAIRTFGSLGGQGLLGVCFGTVITMNSPGGLAHGRNNWQSTLWHEFCHVVTLTLTQNKMPRWLSEGISVHEESQRNAIWGMPMDATFRRMILEEKAAKSISQLSSAFLNAESDDHLTFAYYQSSQVVGYLLERFGPEKLQSILRDLAGGKRINDAIADNTEPLEKLEPAFEKHLEAKAVAFGEKADWKKPEPEDVNPLDPESLAGFTKKNPDSLWTIHRQIDSLIEQEKWADVLPLAERLIALVPEDFGGEGGYQIKANALRELKRDDEEIAVLRQIAEHETSAMPIFLRLIELDQKKQDWPQVRANAERALALNPFLRTPQQAMADAADALGEKDRSIAAYRRVLILDPDGAAMTHFRLAKLLRETDAAQAKKHLLDCLALAPRFRDGLAMLRELP
jgi:tetratricopeptide (TPR) repeat protein